MQFYLRDKELNQLSNFIDSTAHGSKFILITGARKVGKTAFVDNLLRSNKGIYLTITPKATSMQLNDISDYLKEFNPPGTFIPKFENWKHLFEYFFTIAKEESFTIVVDEFQNLESVDADAYTEFIGVWNRFTATSKLNFVAVSFSQDFINKMFHNQDSLFYKLPNYTLKLSPFSFLDVISLFKLNKSNLILDDIVDIYLLFGGYPKYYNLMDIFDLWGSRPEEILRKLVFQPYAPLGNELKDIILNLFTRENKTYISILQAIAQNKQTLTEIANSVAIPTTTIGKYLSELESKKNIIKRKLPLSPASIDNSKFGRYFIRSYFENFWFRFIQPEIISYEMKQYEKILLNIINNFEEYRNQRMPFIIKELVHYKNEIHELEQIFPYEVTAVGSLWNRKNSLDVIAYNDELKEVLIGNIYTGSEMMNAEKMQNHIISLSGFDKELKNYSITKVIFHNTNIEADALALSESANIQLCFYANLLRDIYEGELLYEY